MNHIDRLRAIADDSENTTDARLARCLTTFSTVVALKAELAMLLGCVRAMADDLELAEICELNAQAARDAQQHEARQRIAAAVLAAADDQNAAAPLPGNTLVQEWPLVSTLTLADFVYGAAGDDDRCTACGARLDICDHAVDCGNR